MVMLKPNNKEMCLKDDDLHRSATFAVSNALEEE